MAITLPDDLRLDALRGLEDSAAAPKDPSGAAPDTSTTAPLIGRDAPVVTGLSPVRTAEPDSVNMSSKLSNDDIVNVSQDYFADLGQEVATLDPEVAKGLVDPATDGLTGLALDVAKNNFLDGVQDDLSNIVVSDALKPGQKAALTEAGQNIYEGQNFDLLLGKDGAPNELFVAPDLTNDELAAVLQDATELIFEVNAQEQGLTLNQEAFDSFITEFTQTFFVSLQLEARVEIDNMDAQQEENLARIARETLMITRTVQ